MCPYFSKLDELFGHRQTVLPSDVREPNLPESDSDVESIHSITIIAETADGPAENQIVPRRSSTSTTDGPAHSKNYYLIA
jgi:hypothetical protein